MLWTLLLPIAAAEEGTYEQSIAVGLWGNVALAKRCYRPPMPLTTLGKVGVGFSARSTLTVADTLVWYGKKPVAIRKYGHKGPATFPS